MLTDRQVLGLEGERIAAAWLRARGWTVLAERFRSGHRDLDLVVARQDPHTGGRIVAFVEVRTRYSTDWGSPIETIQYQKRRELTRSAKAWIALNRRSNDTYRFDVVGIVMRRGKAVQIDHIEDAFWRDHRA